MKINGLFLLCFVPLNLFGQVPADKKTIYSSTRPIELMEVRCVELGLGTVGSVEAPWSLEADLYRYGRHADNRPEVLVAGDTVQICTVIDHPVVNRYGMEETLTGMALVEHPGTEKERVMFFQCSAPLGRQTRLRITSEKTGTTLWINGEKRGEYPRPVACPVKSFGSRSQENFKGTIERIHIFNYVTPLKKSR